jgi:phosphoribosylglycinamide formyltransferase-1
MNPAPIRIALFGSGGGSNAAQILRHFEGSPWGQVVLLLSENPASGLFALGESWGLPTRLIPPGKHRDSAYLLAALTEAEAELAVLAGYLKQIPAGMVAALPERILNVHPALLPRFGGKGMYGMRVHEAVILSGERRSGMTVHYVNEQLDEGEILFQAEVEIEPAWGPAELQQAVLRLEHRHYPEIVEKVCKKLMARR